MKVENNGNFLNLHSKSLILISGESIDPSINTISIENGIFSSNNSTNII